MCYVILETWGFTVFCNCIIAKLQKCKKDTSSLVYSCDGVPTLVFWRFYHQKATKFICDVHGRYHGTIMCGANLSGLELPGYFGQLEKLYSLKYNPICIYIQYSYLFIYIWVLSLYCVQCKLPLLPTEFDFGASIHVLRFV